MKQYLETSSSFYSIIGGMNNFFKNNNRTKITPKLLLDMIDSSVTISNPGTISEDDKKNLEKINDHYFKAILFELSKIQGYKNNILSKEASIFEKNSSNELVNFKQIYELNEADLLENVKKEFTLLIANKLISKLATVHVTGI